MTDFKHLIWQGLCYALFILPIGYFADTPAYDPLPDNSAVIKLSLRHSGQRLGQCRERTAEELARLPANMRATSVCPRERSPLAVELLLNGERRLHRIVEPSGWQNDGMASLYERLTVPVGTWRVQVRMKEHLEAEAFHYRLEKTLVLEHAEVLAIDFRNSEKGFEWLQR